MTRNEHCFRLVRGVLKRTGIEYFKIIEDPSSAIDSTLIEGLTASVLTMPTRQVIASLKMLSKGNSDVL